MSKPKNTVAVLKELRKFEFVERPIPVPKEGNVIIKIACTGVCGSDVHYWAHGKCGPFVVKAPIVLGHETSGTVYAVGPGVKNVQVGTRVAIEPGVPCKRCTFCITGVYNLCPQVEFLATPPFDGSLATFIEHNADFVFPLPDNMSFEEGALIEPLSVGVQACRRGGVTAGSTVLIIGGGPVGLVSLLVARASGATKILVVDINEHRLKVAKEQGADATFLATDPKILEKLLAFGPITQTLECSGADSALVLSISATAPGGKIVSIGRSAKSQISLPIFEAADKEIVICGSFRYANVYPTSIELVRSGQVKVKSLVTHTFGFNEREVQKAFETSEKGLDNAIKVIIKADHAKV